MEETKGVMGMVSDIIIGSIGLVFILIAFFWDEFYEVNNTYLYNVLNLVGAGLLMQYSLALKSMPFIILQAIWGLVALVKMLDLAFWKKKKE